MNIAKKLYCRGYQSVFHFAIPVMPYKMPKRVDSIKNIPEVLKKQNKKHPLIVTDPGISACGLLKLVEDVFEKKGVPYSVYDKTVPNPTDENVAEALAIYKAEGCDSLVAIGGGSSIDCAKGIGACIARPDLTLAKMEGILKVIAPIPTLVAIPTTAGTGSDCKHFLKKALLRDHGKIHFSHVFIPPLYSLNSCLVTGILSFIRQLVELRQCKYGSVKADKFTSDVAASAFSDAAFHSCFH